MTLSGDWQNNQFTLQQIEISTKNFFLLSSKKDFFLFDVWKLFIYPIFVEKEDKKHFYTIGQNHCLLLKGGVVNQVCSLCLLWEPFVELSSIQMFEPNNRPTMRNLIKVKSQTSSLINQRCWLSFIAKCVSLSHAVCGCWSTLSLVLINTRTHTLYLSLCLSATLLSFPIFPFRIKALSAFVWWSIEIQISPYLVVLIS